MSASDYPPSPKASAAITPKTVLDHPESTLKLYFVLRKQTVGSRPVNAPIKKIIPLKNYSNIAIIFFDEEELRAQIAQHQLIAPTPIALALAVDTENATRLSIYGTGQVQLLQDQDTAAPTPTDSSPPSPLLNVDSSKPPPKTPPNSPQNHALTKDRITFSSQEISQRLIPLTKDSSQNSSIRQRLQQNMLNRGEEGTQKVSARDPSHQKTQQALHRALRPYIGDLSPQDQDPQKKYHQTLFDTGAFFVLSLDPSQGGCIGDSGSPITITIDDTEYPLGLISRGMGKAKFLSSQSMISREEKHATTPQVPCSPLIFSPSMPFWGGEIRLMSHFQITP